MCKYDYFINQRVIFIFCSFSKIRGKLQEFAQPQVRSRKHVAAGFSLRFFIAYAYNLDTYFNAN